MDSSLPVNTVLQGDCCEILPTHPANFYHTIVVDPPYGLEFMGKEWDRLDGDGWRTGAGMSKPGIGERNTEWPSFGGGDSANATCATCGGRMRGAKKCSCEQPDWRVKGKPLEFRNNRADVGKKMQEWHYRWAVEALRVARPGAFLLAFGGTRTYHRLACAIEDAGWEIRDCVMWVYGQGFPKSLNVRCKCGTKTSTEHNLRSVWKADISPSEPAKEESKEIVFTSVPEQIIQGNRTMPSESTLGAEESGVEGRRDLLSEARQLQTHQVRQVPSRVFADGPQGWLRDGTPLNSSKTVGSSAFAAGSGTSQKSQSAGQQAGKPATIRVELRTQESGMVCPKCGGLMQWDGWGTALKPAWEPIIVARKPLEGTVAQNLQKWGVGAMNIDGCRIETEDKLERPLVDTSSWHGNQWGANPQHIKQGSPIPKDKGRWPANLILSWPEDEYELRDDVTPAQLRQLAEWMDANR